MNLGMLTSLRNFLRNRVSERWDFRWLVCIFLGHEWEARGYPVHTSEGFYPEYREEVICDRCDFDLPHYPSSWTRREWIPYLWRRGSPTYWLIVDGVRRMQEHWEYRMMDYEAFEAWKHYERLRGFVRRVTGSDASERRRRRRSNNGLAD